MDKRQAFILVGMVTFVLTAMALAVYFSGTPDPLREKLSTPKRFTAKPGTDREQAQALSSSKRPAQEATGPPSNSGEPPIPVKSISPPKEDLSPEEQVLREALNSLDPVAGMEKINAQLALPQSQEDAARLYAARAQLALETRPPDFDAAAADFARAVERAPTARLRFAILASEAQMWIALKDTGAASQRLGAALDTPAPISPERIRLRALLARVNEIDGQINNAEAEYRKLIGEALSYGDEHSSELDDLIRLAALSLSRIYRATDRPGEANDLARSLAKHFLESQEPAPAH